MNEETRWELQNLDSQVRHPQDRRVMMTELHRMGRWDRSSTLGELAFSGPRLRGGLDGARDLWEFAYPKAWVDYVVPSAKSAGVDEELVWSIMRAESQYRAEARSPVGATGLMQIMPFTGEKVSSQLLGKDHFQPTDLQDPEINVRFGARYLQRLIEKFGGSLPLVAAGYNAGPHRVQNWLRGFGALRMDEFIEHIPFVETRNYVKKVSRNYQIYRLLYRDDRGSLSWLVKPVGVTPDSGPNALEVW
jgi:soluble lytic murein transglycosylase